MIVKAVSGGEFPNLSLYLKDRELRLHSSRPYTEAKKLLSTLPLQTDALLLCGIGLGYLLEKALENSNLKIIFAAELSEDIYKAALKLRPSLETLIKNPRVVLLFSPQKIETLICSYVFDSVAFIVPRTYGELFPEECSLYKKNFSSALSRKEISKNTLVRFGRTWIKNLFRNMHRQLNCIKVSSFNGLGKGKPALIIGAGPSLDEALPYLKAAQNKALYITADTALPMLDSAGIKPDFVVSVDPQEQNAFYLRYMKNHNHYLITDPGVHSSVFEGYTDKHIILTDAAFPFCENFISFWGTCGMLKSGGSVSTNAFDFARLLSCEKIILVGQDLSFTEKKHYSTGNLLWEFGRTAYHRLNPYHNIQARSSYSSHSILLKNRSGGSVRGDARFSAFISWFIEEIPKSSCPVYTAGEGAFLEGVIHLDIDAAFALLDKDIDKNFIPSIEKIDAEPLKEYLKYLQKGLKKILPYAQKAIQHVNQGASLNNLQKESTELQKALKSFPEGARIIEIGMQNSVWQAIQLKDQASNDDIYQSTVLLCREILENIHFLDKAIKKSLAFLE